MRGMNIITLILVIVGGINWGLVGLSDFNLVNAIFGEGSAGSRLVYMLVGLSALWQLIPLVQAIAHTHEHGRLDHEHDRIGARW